MIIIVFIGICFSNIFATVVYGAKWTEKGENDDYGKYTIEYNYDASTNKLTAKLKSDAIGTYNYNYIQSGSGFTLNLEGATGPYELLRDISAEELKQEHTDQSELKDVYTVEFSYNRKKIYCKI